MRCPHCRKQDLKTKHTYRAGETATTKRLECPGCLTVFTYYGEIVAINPVYGQGAKALAERKKRQTPPR